MHVESQSRVRTQIHSKSNLNGVRHDPSANHAPKRTRSEEQKKGNLLGSQN